MNRLAWGSFATTVLFGSVLYTVLSNRPSEHSGLVIALPVTTFLLVTSLYTWLRAIFNRPQAGNSLVIIRQGILLGLVLGSLLYLQGLRVLSVIDGLLLVGAAILLEIFFQAEKTDLRTPKDE